MQIDVGGWVGRWRVEACVLQWWRDATLLRLWDDGILLMTTLIEGLMPQGADRRLPVIGFSVNEHRV